jgi:hypothetical protein
MLAPLRNSSRDETRKPVGSMAKTEITAHAGEEQRLRALARELAMGIKDVETILKDHGLRRKELDGLLRSPYFKMMYDDALAAWNSNLNARQRVDVKTMIMVEEALPEMYALLMDRTQPLAGKVELFKTLQRGAGIGQVTGSVSDANKISITINMGSDHQLMVEKPMIDVTPNADEDC